MLNAVCQQESELRSLYGSEIPEFISIRIDVHLFDNISMCLILFQYMVHGFLAYLSTFKSSNHPTSTLLKGTEASTAQKLARGFEPNHRQELSEATGPLGLLTVNGIAKDTHLNGPSFRARGPLMFPRFMKKLAMKIVRSTTSLLEISCISVTNGTFNRGRGTCGSLIVP